MENSAPDVRWRGAKREEGVAPFLFNLYKNLLNPKYCLL